MTESHTNPVESLALNSSEAWVEQFIPALKHCNVIHMSPSIGNPEYCNIDQIIDYIDRRYRPSEVTHIVFNSESEGFFRLLIDRINELLKIILPRYNLIPEDITFLSGAMPTEENTQIFRSLIEPSINLYYVSSWPSCGVHGNEQTAAWHDDSESGTEKTKVLLCYNNAPKPHRVSAVSQLIERGLRDCSYISACFDYNEIPETALLSVFKNTGPSTLRTLNNEQLPLELTITRNNFRNRRANHFFVGLHDYLHHRNSYFSLITESQYFNANNNHKHKLVEPSYTCAFATEKTYRTIYLRHPFVMLSTPGFLKNLRQTGYHTFHPYINEDYDLIEDDEQRLIAVMDEVSRLVSYTNEQWQEWLNHIQPIVEHNYQHLKNNYEYAHRA